MQDHKASICLQRQVIIMGILRNPNKIKVNFSRNLQQVKEMQ